MISFKEEFIKKYIEKLLHRIIQELNDKLPEKDYFANMIDKANESVKELVKLL